MSTQFSPKLGSARPRPSAALTAAKLSQFTSDQIAALQGNKTAADPKKKKKTPAAVALGNLAMTGKF